MIGLTKLDRQRLRLSPLEWRLIPESQPGTIISFSMLDSQHGWAVGPGGSVYSYTLGIWAMSLQGSARRLPVRGSSAAVQARPRWRGIQCPAIRRCPQRLNCITFRRRMTTSSLRRAHCQTTGSPSSTLARSALPNGERRASLKRWTTLSSLQRRSYTTVPAAGEDVKAVSMLPDGSGFASGVGSVLRLHTYPYSVYLPLIRR